MKMKKVLLVAMLVHTLLHAKNNNIERVGDWVQILIPLSGYGTTLYLKDEEGEIEFYKSFFSTLGTTHVLKNTVRKERPDHSDNKSFPSGHTSASFQGATFLHKRYGIQYAIPAYLGAAYVGYSRIYANKHDLTDVIAGAIIGSGFSYYFTTPYKFKGVQIQPAVYSSDTSGQNLFGFKMSW
ncbi:phosphatase PAP2 family protein [Sulfurovum sp. zt1-1]|uniref:Phosphatase PAP2 family protein n=1 Tax=Sulfurovum zhangzhouensis TaxID=3019067 RepID=A0ABT7QZ58_9BACT|nr:phosphatase PAP2 family protein [Sulfurovum zhangzhouensis]MDM5272133.1 phosphatase PAP2 family protein [Sulfurovum zhangzhouensis]